MTTEQLLLEKWRKLPSARKLEVIDFIEFLEMKEHAIESYEPTLQSNQPLGMRLQRIREQIVASGASLLTEEEIEKEVANRRGGYQD